MVCYLLTLVEMAGINIDDLNLSDDEGLTFDIEEENDSLYDPKLCLVGRFLVNRPVQLNSMKKRMSEVWRPVKGVAVKEAQPGLFLFQFFHKLDMEEILNGGPWTYDNHMLVLEKLKVGAPLKEVQLFHLNLWVQVHNLPIGMMKEKVGMGLGNYIGEFLEYDVNNQSSFWREYMRLRVRFDVRKPLKIEKKIKATGGDWCVVNFKYEKLGTFCFVCGVLGHAENKCEVRFSQEDDGALRRWSNVIRAAQWRPGGRGESKWLREEGGSRGDMASRKGSVSENGGANSGNPQQHNPSDQSVQEPRFTPIGQQLVQSQKGVGPVKQQSMLTNGSQIPSVISPALLTGKNTTIPALPAMPNTRKNIMQFESPIGTKQQIDILSYEGGSEDIDVQLHRKRMREENSSACASLEEPSHHFLSARPSSQDCRDQ